MEVTLQHPPAITRLLFWGVIGLALLLLPFTSFALVRSFRAPASMAIAIGEAEPSIAEKYDAKYHETRCYQIMTLRNYHEAQEQWETPCACTANVAVLAEVEYAHMLQEYRSSLPETRLEYLLYDFDLISERNNEPEALQANLKEKYRSIIRHACWAPHGLEAFWIKTYSKPEPIKRGPLAPLSASTIG